MDKLEPQHHITNFIDRCKQSGLSVTHQRIAIYTELVKSKAHPSAEMIFQNLKKKYPSMSFATVYKTMETFIALNLVYPINTGQEVIRYDGNPELHHHFICRGCNAIEDIADSAFGHIELPDSVAKEYTILTYGLVLQGICKTCRKKGNNVK
ncbi:MAG: transcriptional repressor [bacterium]|nr:transcriptional repressor [bacterium]